MVNIVRNIKRLNQLAIAAACAALMGLLCFGSVQAQSGSTPYTARGFAPVADGNISAARAAALSDAQQKVVLAALADRIPAEKLTGYFATVHALFISRPEIYVQRFKIISETTLGGMHQVVIEAFSEDALLDRDLESIGMSGQIQQALQVFLLAAEALPGEERYAGWWMEDQVGTLDFGEQMAFFFRERGAAVVQEPGNITALLRLGAGSVFPDRETVFEVARQAGAGIAVFAKASLKQSGTRPGSSFAQVQCDVSADVFDVRTHAAVVQTATTALGVHIDHDAAVRDAVVKASSRLVEQILDRLLVAVAATHTFTVRCSFSRGLPELRIREFFDLLRAALPEIVHLDVRDGAEATIKMAHIESSVESAAFIQKALHSDLGGYRLNFGAVDGSMIDLSVASPGKQ